jgi:hypothetical protein
MPASLWLTFLACSGEPREENDTPGAGVLLVGEGELLFEVLDIGTDAPASTKLWIQNAGAGPLTVTAPRIEGSEAFAVSGDAVVLQPYEPYAYQINFDPGTPFFHEAVLIIDSDAAGAPVTEVALRGEAIAPVLEIDESVLDLGVVAVGCSAIRDVIVRNAGNEVLELTPSIVGSLELELEDGATPVEILPGHEWSIDVSYEPVDGTVDSATLELDSSDPIRPHAAVELEATGQAAVQQIEWFEGATHDADIVFVVDNSGSMTEEQAGLVHGMDAFLEALSAAGADYRIGVLTTDAATFAGEVVTGATPDGGTVLDEQVLALGVGGSGTERGLQMLYDCLQPGSDCSEDAGFLRPEALLQGIIVSDEPDQSALAPDDYVDQFWALKSDPGLVRIDAIAGDVPGPPDCASSSSPGFGYDVAQELTGGTFLSVCGDWEENLSLLGSSALVSRYPLSEAPTLDTIEVFVDGIPAESGTWTYVDWSGAEWINAIEFQALPAFGAAIEVRYDVVVVCD